MNHPVDIAAPSVMRRVPSELRDAVKGAARAGWTGRKAGSGGLILHSPDGVHSVTIPITINHQGVARDISRDILRYTPVEVARAMALETRLDPEGEDAVALDGLLTPAVGAFGARVMAHLVPEEETFVPDRIVTKAEAWMARATSDGSKADLYPSEAVIERTWSDDTVNYICSFCMDFESDNPRSVAAHYSGHTRRGETQPTTAHDNPTELGAPIDGYRTKRVASLAREILAGLDLESDSINDSLPMEDLARRIAEHIVEARHAKGLERIEDEPEPAGPEDILARIKRLLMRDEQDRLRRAEVESSNLRTQITEVEQERDEWKGKAARYRETLGTLSSIAREESA